MALENLSQKILLFAYEQAKEKEKEKERVKEYASFVKKAPSFIQNNGLLYTLAYINKKSEALANDIRLWHIDKRNILNLDKNKCASIDDFLKEILTKEDSDIRLLTLETLALLKCLRRFVKEDN
jgi:CRISPR type III-B/RAMP module-associated protein Cmr5